MNNNDIIMEFCKQDTVSNYLDYKDYLASLYRFFKEKKQRYSYLQMAEDFGFVHKRSSSHHYRQTSPSEKGGERIITKLPLSRIRKKLLSLLGNTKMLANRTLEKAF